MPDNEVWVHGERFDLVDARRGDDFEEPDVEARVVSLFRNNRSEWDELFTLVIEDDCFDTPSNIHRIEVRAKGSRKSYLGKARRREGWIRITPCSQHQPVSVVEVMVHELGHIAVPIKRKRKGLGKSQRVVHGHDFKNAAYQLAQYANILGLLPESSVRKDIGMSSYRGANNAAVAAVESTELFESGNIIRWSHKGYKHGGTYTGIVIRVNDKTYTVKQKTKNGEECAGGEWRLPKTNPNLAIVEEGTG